MCAVVRGNMMVQRVNADVHCNTRLFVACFMTFLFAVVFSACAMFPSGDPERDQARVIAASREAAVAKGAAEAAEEQAENAENCPATRTEQSSTDCDRDKEN
jgi:hypothetical protein